MNSGARTFWSQKEPAVRRSFRSWKQIKQISLKIFWSRVISSYFFALWMLFKAAIKNRQRRIIPIIKSILHKRSECHPKLSMKISFPNLKFTIAKSFKQSLSSPFLIRSPSFSRPFNYHRPTLQCILLHKLQLIHLRILNPFNRFVSTMKVSFTISQTPLTFIQNFNFF